MDEDGKNNQGMMGTRREDATRKMEDSRSIEGDCGKEWEGRGKGVGDKGNSKGKDYGEGKKHCPVSHKI